jgi:type II protein arginine methyltransferase
MVPALAAAAKHIIAQNGYADRVSIHGIMSTDLKPSDVGGLFDLLVCEIVDDQLLGEGVLTTIADARRRLLSPNAAIIPCGASVFALPVQMRIGTRSGLALDDLNLFSTDMAFAPRAHTGCKLQHWPPDEHVRLAPPLRLFEFDFAHTPIDELACSRSAPELSVTFERDGLLTAFLIYFELHADRMHRFSNGPHQPRLVAWDQSVRYLPIEVRVRAGQRVAVSAYHDYEAVRVGVPHLTPDMVAGCVGHTEVMGAALQLEQRKQLEQMQMGSRVSCPASKVSSLEQMEMQMGSRIRSSHSL